MLNDNAQLTFGYGSTLFYNAPTDLRLSQFRVTLIYGWHPLIEGVKRRAATISRPAGPQLPWTCDVSGSDRPLRL